MKLIKKLDDSTSLKLKELMNALEETGCSPKEKLKVQKFCKFRCNIYGLSNQFKRR